jgi:hypothetical protein
MNVPASVCVDNADQGPLTCMNDLDLEAQHVLIEGDTLAVYV